MQRILLLLLLTFSFNFIKAQNAKKTLPFYTTQLKLEYNPSMVTRGDVRLDDQDIVNFYKSLEGVSYQTFLNTIQNQKSQLGLNDWLYFDLMRRGLDKILVGKSQAYKTIYAWFLLTKSGYDTRMAYKNGKAYVYVYSKDHIFECPMFKESGRLFINLTALSERSSRKITSLYTPNYKPNRGGMPFSFQLETMPLLPSKEVKKTVNFSYNGQGYAVNLEWSDLVIKLMKDYPFLEEKRYLEIPLSEIAQSKLLPQLRQIIAGKSQEEALQLLVTFTRSSFNYKEDEKYFGDNKPMIAEEVFHYKYSDCEDRSALFFNLVKELLNLPMVIVAYPDHLTIGVETNQRIGKPLQYRGRKYTICDPTGPINSTKIGVYPKGYEYKSFQVIGQYQ